MSYTHVADLTVEEFKDLVQEVVAETILELFDDPDEGLELREEIRERLNRSLVRTTGQTRSAQDVAARLGLDW
ncbi:MAG TPA: hypothetical protein EYP41_18605 [Anaerolineae bacterium]|nr:hypothetical protein [Anaerolineae bacterium]